MWREPGDRNWLEEIIRIDTPLFMFFLYNTNDNLFIYTFIPVFIRLRKVLS